MIRVVYDTNILYSAIRQPKGLPAKAFDHARQILAGEDRIIDHKIADGLPVFAAFYRRKLLHFRPPCTAQTSTKFRYLIP